MSRFAAADVVEDDAADYAGDDCDDDDCDDDRVASRRVYRFVADGFGVSVFCFDSNLRLFFPELDVFDVFFSLKFQVLDDDDYAAAAYAADDDVDDDDATPTCDDDQSPLL